jgi:hypothetical protein
MRQYSEALLIALALTGARLSAQVSVQGSTIHEFDAAPGATRIGSIPVTNTSPSAQLVRLYLTDYLFFADGTSRYDQPGSVPRSNAEWVQLGARELTVPPGATVPVPYTVRVPGNDSLSGSYWSLVMVEGVGAQGASVRAGVGLTAKIRYAVQVVTHLPNTGLRSVTVKSGKLVTVEGRGPALELEIANTGDRATKFDVTTELYDSGGTVRGRFQQSRGLTYPGTSLTHRVELGSLPPGTYKAVVVIDAGSGSLTGAEYTLKL